MHGWTLGIIFTIFVGVIRIQGIAASFDGVSIRTTKYAIEAAPEVGRVHKQSIWLVLTDIKNAVGVSG